MFDLSLPGYKYLGPFNSLNKGTPTNFNDFVAYLHDLGYGEIIRRGGNPYLKWSNADAMAYKHFTSKDYGGAIGKKFFGFKKKLYEVGIIGNADETATPMKRLRGTDSITPLKSKRLKISKPDEKTWQADFATLSFGDSPSQEQTSTNMADGEGSGNAAGLSETPVDKVYDVTRGPEDYTFVTLPLLENYDISGTFFSYDIIYRMTSVYDTRVETATSDINVGTGTMNVRNVNETSQRKAYWFDYYSSIYNYYHVVSCRYTIRIENLAAKPMWIHKMFANDDIPPTTATNREMRVMWKNVESFYLDRKMAAVDTDGEILQSEQIDQENREAATGGTTATPNYSSGNMVTWGGSNKCIIRGEYRPGDFKREIRLDSDVENWTLINTNPAVPERLIIRAKPWSEALDLDSTLNYGDRLNFRIEIQLDYLTEFKELVYTLRYPVAAQPLTISINSDPAS